MSLKNGQKRTRLKVDDNKVLVKTEQDVSPILDYTHAARRVSPGRFERKDDFVHVGRIPDIVIKEMGQLGIDFWNPDEGDEKAIARLLNTTHKKCKTVDFAI